MKEKEMNIFQLILLTVVPSGIFTGLYIILGMRSWQIPSLVLFFILAILTLFPFEMGVVLQANKKEYGKYGIQCAFAGCEKMQWWKVGIYGVLLFCYAGVISITIAPLENRLFASLSDGLYGILPAYFNWTNMELLRQYPREILIITSILYIILNVFVCPILEEIYFRGYLTNKLKRYGVMAPVFVTLAFSFYHWWLPFNNLFRISIFVLVAVIAYKKKNIYISMVFHVLCNLFSTVSFIMALFG